MLGELGAPRAKGVPSLQKVTQGGPFFHGQDGNST